MEPIVFLQTISATAIALVAVLGAIWAANTLDRRKAEGAPFSHLLLPNLLIIVIPLFLGLGFFIEQPEEFPNLFELSPREVDEYVDRNPLNEWTDAQLMQYAARKLWERDKANFLAQQNDQAPEAPPQ